MIRSIVALTVLGALTWAGFRGYGIYQRTVMEKKMLQQIIQRLKADSRIAEVLVTGVEYNPVTKQHMTTIKFLEYNSDGKPLWPKYFTFAGNVIQFQSLVVRFTDDLVEMGDEFKGRSVFLFWKVFILEGEKTQEYEITKINEVPAGYKVGDSRNEFEEQIWQRFWIFALNSQRAMIKGIKNAQIEAPGTKFVPGFLYTLKIEHDGGIRIDAQKIPEILRGETIY